MSIFRNYQRISWQNCLPFILGPLLVLATARLHAADCAQEGFGPPPQGGMVLRPEHVFSQLNANVANLGNALERYLHESKMVLEQKPVNYNQFRMLTDLYLKQANAIAIQSPDYLLHLHTTLYQLDPNVVARIVKSRPYLEAIIKTIDTGGRPVNISEIRQNLAQIEKLTTTIENSIPAVPTPSTQTPQARDIVGVKILQASLNGQAQASKNTVFSQVSLDAALTLIGAGYDDPTLSLLEKYLGNPIRKVVAATAQFAIDVPGVKLLSGNNLWAVKDFNIKPEYLEFVDREFDGLRPLNLDVSKPKETAQSINDWIGSRTNNLLGKVVQEGMITSDLVMILVNAIYFKGTWLEQFDKADTSDGPFAATDLNGKIANVDAATMAKFGSEMEVRIDGADSARPQVQIRLPYVGNRFAMYLSFASQPVDAEDLWQPKIYQPDPKVDIAEVHKNLAYGATLDPKQFVKMDLEKFTMPKFKITSAYDLLKVLKENGYGALAQSGVLKRLTDDQRAYLSFLIQKATIEVNEEGSEAAAVTVGGVGLESVRAPDPSILVNGPFAYVIRDDEKGTVLFQGVVRDPREN